MSDSSPTNDSATTAEGGGDEQAGQQAEAAAEQQPQIDWRAQADKWEKRAQKDAKALDALKRKVEGLVGPEQVHTIETQLTETSNERDRLMAEATRYRVALETGLGVDMARRLVGDDEDALRDDAEALKALMGAPRATPGASAGTGDAVQKESNGAATKGHADLNSLLRSMAGGAK